MDQFYLSQAPVGQKLSVALIEGGHAAKLRLASMGIREGAQICLARASSSGPIVVEVGNGRIALGRGIAHKILVQEISQLLAAE